MSFTSPEYLEQLNAIREIRDTIQLSDGISLPQICVIGATSTGKSTFLTRLTGVHFPTDTGMCTKTAIVVNCRYDPDIENPQYKIRSGDKKYEDVNTPDALKQKIRQRQDEILGSNKDKQAIGQEEISVTVSSKSVCDVTVVDLPGFVLNADISSLGLDIKSLVESYIARQETLICVCTPAQETLVNVEGISFAKKFDPNGDRTIRILTQFDIFNNPDARRRAFQWVTNDAALMSENGPHAIVSYTEDQGRHLTADEELQVLQKVEEKVGQALPPGRKGVASFNRRAQTLFASMIRNNLPKLQRQTEQKKSDVEAKLSAIGRHDRAGHDMVQSAKDLLVQTNDYFGAEHNKCVMEEFKAGIIAVNLDAIVESRCATGANNPYECPEFQGQGVFNNCCQDIKDEWSPILDAYIEKTNKLLEHSFGSGLLELASNDANLISKWEGLPPKLRNSINAEFRAFFRRSIKENFAAECQKALERESSFATANPYYSEVCHGRDALPDALMDRIIQRMQIESQRSPIGCMDEDHSEQPFITFASKEAVKEILDNERRRYAKEQLKVDHDARTKDRVLRALQAHFQTEKKTYTDVILKITKTNVIQARSRWINNMLATNTKILAAAEEDQNTVSLRAELLNRHGRLEEVAEKLLMLGGVEDHCEAKANDRKRPRSEDDDNDDDDAGLKSLKAE